MKQYFQSWQEASILICISMYIVFHLENALNVECCIEEQFLK